MLELPDRKLITPEAFTRHGFLKLFGLTAASVAAAPLIADGLWAAFQGPPITLWSPSIEPVSYSIAELSAILKEYYSEVKIKDLVYRSNKPYQLLNG